MLQRQEDGVSRLKRLILIGDHHQLPPVVKNMAFQKYSHLDQSLFTRFIRLGTPYVQLNAQVQTYYFAAVAHELCFPLLERCIWREAVLCLAYQQMLNNARVVELTVAIRTFFPGICS